MHNSRLRPRTPVSTAIGGWSEDVGRVVYDFAKRFAHPRDYRDLPESSVWALGQAPCNSVRRLACCFFRQPRRRCGAPAPDSCGGSGHPMTDLDPGSSRANCDDGPEELWLGCDSLMRKRCERQLRAGDQRRRVAVQMGANSVKATTLTLGALAACLIAGLFAAGSPPSTEAAGSWNPKAAAAYLDQREEWWMAWPAAARDHGTFCVSCHTAVPYGLSRPALRAALSEAGPSADEQKLLDNVTKRVRLWKVVAPFYSDEKDGTHKTEQARGTEAVLNALILASRDAGNGRLSDDGRAAFDNMWALQQTAGDERGAWSWLQFNNEPWEAYDSQYYGASLAAVAVGTVSQDYRSTPGIQNNLQMLHEYVNREYARQSPINRIVLLWASAEWPGLLARERQESIINEVVALQRADGGWSLASLVGPWKRVDSTPLEVASDGYATGLITLALKRAGVPRNDPHIQQGLSWLMHNQNQTGGWWPASSLNRQLDPSYGSGRFMSDAATAYAVLALTEAKAP